MRRLVNRLKVEASAYAWWLALTLNVQKRRRQSEPADDYELWGERFECDGGYVLRVHRASDCKGPHCCIHNPSVHALSEAPLNWRSDRNLMERICTHGVGHPDPDSLAFMRSAADEDDDPDYREYALSVASAAAVHGCDGCC